MKSLAEQIKDFEALQKQMNIGHNRPKWVKGANGLWHSFDPVAQRKRERAARKAARDAAKLAKAA